MYKKKRYLHIFDAGNFEWKHIGYVAEIAFLQMSQFFTNSGRSRVHDPADGLFND